MAQTVCIIVSPADRERLRAIAADRNKQRKHVERAQIVLASAERGPSRPVPAVIRLARAGVVVCAGSDGIRDTWGPYGNADMLERAMFIGLRNNLRRDDDLRIALDIVTTGGATAHGLPDYGLTPGCGVTWCWLRPRLWPSGRGCERS